MVNNRILLKINGKPITVVDVVKKMDLIFYRQFPHLLTSDQARYEFYMNNFRMVFSAFVNDMLVIADAEEKEVEVTEGDIREEMESIFGPDVVGNIDRLGLPYTEAWELIKKEILVQRMNQMMIRSKSQAEVQPKDLKNLYDEYVKAHPPEKEWHYHIVTVRGIDKETVQSTLDRTHTYLLARLVEKNMALAQLSSMLQKEFGVEVSFSEEYIRKEHETSALHKKALQALVPMTLSPPIVQANNKEGGYIGRLFFLKEEKMHEPPSFTQLENDLHRELLQKAMARNGRSYSDKLRSRYGINDEYLAQMIPSDFTPFTLR